MQYLFPTDLTYEEEAAGFILTEIENPSARFRGDPPVVRAVIYRVNASFRLVKMDPSTGIEYNLYRFGVFHRTPNAKPKWIPVRFATKERDPNRLAEAVAQWIRDNPNPHYTTHIPPG